MRFIRLLLLLVACLVPAEAQAQAELAIPAAVGTAVAGKQCLKHIGTCTVVVIGGLAVVGVVLSKRAAVDSRRSDYCPEGLYVDLYRAVSAGERRKAIERQRYEINFVGFTGKQFWFTEADAQEFVDRMYEPGQVLFMIASKACVETVKEGEPLYDAGQHGITFHRRNLDALNSDADATGGIRFVRELYPL